MKQQTSSGCCPLNQFIKRIEWRRIGQYLIPEMGFNLFVWRYHSVIIHHDECGLRRPAACRQRNSCRKVAAGCDCHGRPGMIHDVIVIILSICHIGGHSDCTNGDCRKVGDGPFGPVFRRNHHPVTRRYASCYKHIRKASDLVRNFVPAPAMPLLLALFKQQGASPCVCADVKNDLARLASFT